MIGTGPNRLQKPRPRGHAYDIDITPFVSSNLMRSSSMSSSTSSDNSVISTSNAFRAFSLAEMPRALVTSSNSVTDDRYDKYDPYPPRRDVPLCLDAESVEGMCLRHLISYPEAFISAAYLAGSGKIEYLHEMILRYPAVLDMIDEETGRTLLHYAVREGNLDNARFLLEYFSVKVDVPDASGYTPLHYAAGGDRAELCEMLLIHGADAMFNYDKGQSPMHVACRKRRYNAIRVLAERGVQILSTLDEDAIDYG